MSQPGIGAMLHYLSGGSSNDPKKYLGKTVEKAEVIDNKFHINFTDGTKIQIFDDGQSCCEHRYMTCDDDLSKIVGGKLISIETKPGAAPEKEEEYSSESHEVVFLDIQTDKGFVTFATHNEHNGYYGGFGLNIEELT